MKKIKTMIIENDTEKALFYESCGVDRIFIDLERIGKEVRQGHLDTFISNHRLDDLTKIRNSIQKAEIITRVNPINPLSENEINDVLNIGTDIIMLPMFQSEDEVKRFIEYVDGRAKVNLLLETPQAAKKIDDILCISGIDEIHIGLNDMHLAMNLRFMFQLLSLGFIDSIVKKIKSVNMPYGIGGVSTLDGGAVSGRLVIQDYSRLGSEFVILSRSFKKLVKKEDFKKELEKIINTYNEYSELNENEKNRAKKELDNEINEVVRKL